MLCKSCHTERELVYRGMCDSCAADYRYARYRGWIERKAMRLGKRFPKEGTRRRRNGQIIGVEDGR